jgi:hypothetical protein
MRSVLFTAGLIALLPFLLSAQTEIADGSTVSGSWTKDQSPYHIKGVVTVPVGQTLTIEPGVVVKFRADTVTQMELETFGSGKFKLGMMRVRGNLVAKGTPEERILFTRLEQEDLKDPFWGAIQVCASLGESVFSHCTFEYANGVLNIPTGENEVQENATGALSFIECGGTVDNCVFRFNWAAINAKHGATVKVNYCTIVDNKYAIEANEDSKVKVVACIFYDNLDGFFINEDNDIEMTYSFVQEGKWDDNILDNQFNNRRGGNPLFKAPKKGDYSLAKKSPCKNKGPGGKNIGAF